MVQAFHNYIAIDVLWQDVIINPSFPEDKFILPTLEIVNMVQFSHYFHMDQYSRVLSFWMLFYIFHLD